MNELERMQILAGIKPKTIKQLRFAKFMKKIRFAKWYVIHSSVAHILWFFVRFFEIIKCQKISDEFFSTFEAWCFGHHIPDNAK